jgi:hypothetical protein
MVSYRGNHSPSNHSDNDIGFRIALGNNYSISITQTTGGKTSGEGTFACGEPCTVKATASDGFTFANWKDGNTIVSTKANYTFTVSSNIHLFASFTQYNYSNNPVNPGRFPQSSERLLVSSDLSGLSKYELKIMRNEIFARHGFIFLTTEMKSYFQTQSWYKPRYNDVSSMLSSVEQKNIALIQRYE